MYIKCFHAKHYYSFSYWKKFTCNLFASYEYARFALLLCYNNANSGCLRMRKAAKHKLVIC